MKVVLLGMIAWIGIMSISSCKKDYQCVCKFTDTTKNFEIKLSGVYKNEATVICDDYEAFVGKCDIK